MTQVSFTRSGGKITGFRVSGHSGFAEEGEDIVLAAQIAKTISLGIKKGYYSAELLEYAAM